MQQTKEVFWKKYNHPGKRPFPLFLFHFLLTPLMRLRYRIKVEGHENIPTDGPLLVLAKHQRYEDIPLGYLFGLAPRRRDVWCLMKHTLGGGLLTKLGGISINRADPKKSKQELRLCRAVLDDQQLLCIFPEQTLFPGKMGRGKLPGFRFIADRPDGPMANVICIGFEYGPKKFLRRRSVVMRLGPAHAYDVSTMNPAQFFHTRMQELAGLCNLKYSFPAAGSDGAEN